MIKELPDWFELDRMKKEGPEFTALEQFIYDQEPAAGDDETKFREQLLAVIKEAEGDPQ